MSTVKGHAIAIVSLSKCTIKRCSIGTDGLERRRLKIEMSKHAHLEKQVRDRTCILCSVTGRYHILFFRMMC